MVEVWQEALKVALIGTERQAPAFTASDEPVGRLLAELNTEDRERTLLRASGILAAYRRAGYCPLQAGEALPVHADAEEKPPVPASVVQDLLVILGGEYREALSEWLQATAEQGWRVPEEHLVALLDFGRGHPENRAALLPLLGRRGRWLAAQNPDWKYALQISLFEIENTPETESADAEVRESIWQTGTKEERVALLHRLRRSAPEQARALVESTWKQDAPIERAEFTAAFATGLSMEDEPFLESALDDKRKDVRTTAQDLLARLPESRLCQRMWARVRLQVKLERVAAEAQQPEVSGGLLGRFRSLLVPNTVPTPVEIITVELPRACDRAMIRDGIEAKPPYSSVGEKTWWLTQMLACIPLTLWSREWGRAPAAIVAANRADEWQTTLLHAWTSALRKERNPEWATALFTTWIEVGPDKMPLDNLWEETLPPEVCEAGLLRLFDLAGERVQHGNPVFTLLAEHQQAWSTPLARAMLVKLHAITGHDYDIAIHMSACAPFIPADLRAEYFEIWASLAGDNAAIQRRIDHHRALDAFCTEMRRKIATAAPVKEN